MKLNIKRGCWCWRIFCFFFIYLFSCIAKHIMTLNQLRLLSCSESLQRMWSAVVLFADIPVYIPISSTPDITSYTRMSHIISYLIMNVPTSLDRV